MSRYSKLINFIQLIDAIDTVDFIDDFEKDEIFKIKPDGVILDDDFGIKIPQVKLRDMTNPIEMFTQEEFKLRYSFSKETVLHILELIVHGLERPSNRGKPVPPIIELLIAIRFFTSGSFQSMSDDIHGVSQPTISRLIFKISALLSELRHVYMSFPSSKEARNLSKVFFNNSKFPSVIGCLGATHVGIKNPGGQISEAYLNEHGYYSLKVQVVSGPNLEFLDILPRWPGSTHHSKIYNISDLKCRLDTNEPHHFLLANSSYPQLDNILTPIKNPKTNSEIKYNNCLNDAYNVPHVLAMWKKRFKCLTSILANKEDTTRSIIYATAVLHNIALKYNEIMPDLDELLPEPKGKDIKRIFPLDKSLSSNPNSIEIRNQFIQEHFK